jgi:hypothetical protein
MSSAFVHAPRTDTSGSAVDVWLRNNWDRAAFCGDDLIATHDGSRHPVKECAVVFRNFRPAAGAYFADPMSVVQYRSAMLTAIKGTLEYDHPVVQKDDVLVPLGTPDWGNTQTHIVLQQSARQWVSGGRNTADMSDSHVITLYYAALQQLVFAAGNATTVAEQRRWFPALVALTQAFSAVHAAYADARKVTKALVLTPGVNDMLQKGLSYVFHSEMEWSTEARLDILAVTIRRNLRYGTSAVGMAPGPFALFTLVPLLRSVAHPSGDVLPESAALLERFNTAAAALLEAYVVAAAAPAVGGAGAVGRSRAAEVNARTLVSLSAAMGASLTEAQATALLAHIASTDASVEPNWVSLGVLPAKPSFAAAVLADRFAVGGRARATHSVKLVPTAEDKLDAYSYKGVEWAAVGFKTPGTYLVMAHDLGIATRGTGDTRGMELTANWRITTGYDILPAQRAGYSLAGEEHVRLPHGAWQYRHAAPLSMETPFVITVTPTTVSLLQCGRQYFTMTKAGSEPALLAFKNLWLQVQYKAPPLPAPAPAPTPVSSGARWSSIVARGGPHAPARSAAGAPSHEERVGDMTPVQLMARLRTLVESDC